MNFRNIHFAPDDTADVLEIEPETEGVAEVATRLRAVINSPEREYALRAGEVEPLPDAVAALIVCKKGKRQVERQQIIANVDGLKDREYTSENSAVIAEFNGTGRKVVWVGNRRDPSVIHLLDTNGTYLETLPLKKEAQWFSQDEVSRDAMRTRQAHLRRDMQRMEELHGPDAIAAAADAAHNADGIRRLIQTFPASSAPPAPTAPSRGGSDFVQAERAVAAVASADGQRTRHTARVVTDEKRQASAVALGAAVRRSAQPEPITADHGRSEIWDDRPSAAPQPHEETW